MIGGLGVGAGGLFPMGDQLDDKDNEQDQGNACGARQQLIQITHRAVQPKKQGVSPSNERWL